MEVNVGSVDFHGSLNHSHETKSSFRETNLLPELGGRFLGVDGSFHGDFDQIQLPWKKNTPMAVGGRFHESKLKKQKNMGDRALR